MPVPSVGEDMDQKELYTADGNVKSNSDFGNSMDISEQVKYILTTWPTYSFLSYPRK
jgi:hypothetical protein